MSRMSVRHPVTRSSCANLEPTHSLARSGVPHLVVSLSEPQVARHFLPPRAHDSVSLSPFILSLSLLREWHFKKKIDNCTHYNAAPSHSCPNLPLTWLGCPLGAWLTIGNQKGRGSGARSGEIRWNWLASRYLYCTSDNGKCEVVYQIMKYRRVPAHRNWQIETATWNLSGFLHCALKSRLHWFGQFLNDLYKLEFGLPYQKIGLPYQK